MDSYFPYPSFRPYQEEMIGKIEESKLLLLSAPTGTGKSVAALTALLSCRTEGEKVVVLTRTKAQGRIFAEEMARIARHMGKPLLTLQLRSKKEICPVFAREETSYDEFLELCRLKECEHRAKLTEGKPDLEGIAAELAEGQMKGRYVDYAELVAEVSGYGCPYMVLQGALRYADVIVLSYPYLLDPFLREISLEKLGIPLTKMLLVIDEAHNLQSLDILERTLSRRTVELAAEELEGFDFSKVMGLFEGGEGEFPISGCATPGEAVFLLEEGRKILKGKLERGRKVSYTYRVGAFLYSASAVEEDKNWMSLRKGRRLVLKPLFPSEILGPLKDCRKLLLMSGTLVPLHGYSLLLGMEDAEMGSIPGAYPISNRSYLAIKSGLNTGKKRRDSLGGRLWQAYARAIEEIYSVSPRATLVFFPSYEVMEAVAGHVSAMCEPRGSSDLEPFWRAITNEEKKLVFAVSGGKLSEGVEFTAGKAKRSVISTVIIAGLPFPIPDFEMELKRLRYEARFGPGRGFLLLSVLPMMNKVMQGVGRAIRSEEDRAVFVFLDDRKRHFRYFPEDIQQEIELVDINRLKGEVAHFHSRP